MPSTATTFDKTWKLVATATSGDLAVTCYAPNEILHWWIQDSTDPVSVDKAIAPYETQRVDLTLRAGQSLFVQTATGRSVAGSVTTDG